MVFQNRGSRVTVLILTGIFLIGAVSASTPQVNIDQQDKVIWLNPGAQDRVVNFRAYCEVQGPNSTTKEQPDEIFVWDGQNRHGSFDQPIENHTYGFDLDNANYDGLGTGSYQTVVNCDGSQEKESFMIDRLSVDLVSSPDSVFLGQDFRVDVEVSSEMGEMKLSEMNPPRLYLKSDSRSYELYGEQSVKSRRMTIQSDRIPLDFIAGDSAGGRIKVETDYSQHKSGDFGKEGLPYAFQIKDEKEIDIRRWNIRSIISPSRRMSYRELSEMNVSLEMMYNGEAVKPETPEDTDYSGRFFVDDSGGNIDPDKGEDDSYEWFSGGYKGENDDGFGLYELSLEKMPKLEVGTHELNVYFEADNGENKKVGELVVENKFTFEGRVSDSDSRAVQTDFTLDSGKYFEKFSTNLNGKFSRRVLPGEYGFDLEFPKGSVTLTETELEENYTGNINYDYFKDPGSMNLDLGGIKPVNLMTVSFGFPFDQGRASMQYNPAKTDDPMDVQVFECVDWNFWNQKCNSGWDKIDDEDVTLPPTTWIAKFPVTPVETDEYGDRSKNVLMSAYVVGTNSGLSVSQVEFGNYRVTSGSSYKVSGKVVSAGSGVEAADVTFSIMDENGFVENVSADSNVNGEFNIGMEMPDEGNYTVHLSAEKEPYLPYGERFDESVWVYKESEIAMNLPTQVEITPGETTETDITISNDGQTTYKDISLSTDYSGDANLSFSDSSFSRIEPGDSREFTFAISLPEDFCEPSCAQYPVFDINLDGKTAGKQVSETFELNSIVQRVDSKSTDSDEDTTSSETDTEQIDNDDSGALTGMFSRMNNPTGEFLANQSSLNIALGLIMVFTMALAGAIKKKKTGDSSARSSTTRDLSRGRGNVNIQKPKVSPSTEEPHVITPDTDNIDEIADALFEKDQEDMTGKEQEFLQKLEEEENVEEVEINQPEPDTESEESETVDEEPEVETEEGEQGSEETQGFKCDRCGESFDTESGLKLHREALH